MPSIFDKPSLTAPVAPTDANPTPLPEVKQDVFGQVQAHFDAKDLERQKLEATKTEPSKLSQQVKADVAVAKSRQIQQTLAVMPDFVQKYVLGSEGEEPDQAEWEQIVPEEYRSETRIDGIARVEGVTRAELRANVEYMRNQDEAALLNDGVGLADVASIATGMLFPSPTDVGMMAVSGGMDKVAKLGYSLGRRLLLEPAFNVLLEAELLQSQGRKMTDQQANAQLASNMAFVAGTHLVGKVIRLGSSKFNASPEVNFTDHSVNESVIDPMSPPSEAEIKGAELTLVTHGSIPIEESAAAVQRRFDEVNMNMPKKAPTKPKEAPRFEEATINPRTAPTPAKERTAFRQGDIVIGKVIIKPRSKTDADILRWPVAVEKDKLAANIALSVEGFNPQDPAHIAILQQVSNDAAKQIEDGLHPRERGSSDAPLGIKKIDNMRLVEDLQARIDEYAMTNPTVQSPEDWPTNVRAPVESIDFQIDRATEVKAEPIGAEGVGEPVEARMLRKMNKEMREINRKMGEGKPYKTNINRLLEDPDTLALGPEGIEKLKVLRDLKDLKFTPDQAGFVNGPALRAISQVLQAIDQQKMRTRVSRAADKNANEAVRANLRGMAYDGDVRRALDAYEEAYAKYLKDKEAYDSDRALAKNLGADGDELPEPMPPAKPKIEASAMIEAAKKSIGAVSGTFGEMPYFGDMTAGKSPMSGIGAMLLANPELRAGIPGVGNLASALAYAQRTAHMTFLEGMQNLDAGTLSTLAHFLRGYNAEEQKQMLFAMWNGTHSNPSYGAIAKHFRDWWDVKQKELAKNGLLTGVITNFAPQDTDKDKIVDMGQEAFEALAKDWFDPSHGPEAAAHYFDAVAEEPRSAQYPHATRMYQRTFKMRDAESAWKLISHFGEKPYALMVMDKVSQIEAKLAAAKLLGPEPAKVLRGIVKDVAAEAMEAWNKATPEERKKSKALDPTTIARWEYVMAGQDGFGGVIGGMFGQYNVTPQSNASALAMAADAAGSVLVGGLSASASRFVPSDLWRSSVFIANQMPYGGGHNPVNLGIGFAKIMREMMHAIGEWKNPETGKRGGNGDIEEILDGMGYNIATARALQVQSQFAQHGMGDTPVQEFKNGAGRIFTKGTRTLASILAQSQFMWQANHAQKYAGLESIITNFGNQIAKSGGDFDALKNGGWNAYNAWVKMRQGGFDNAKFKRLHDAAVNSGALRQVKTWLTGKQHAVDTQMLYHTDPVVGNLFINMVEENYKAGVRDSGAYERHIRRAGGALLTSLGQRSITQQGTWPGMFANAAASFTNVLTATQNDFVMENSINGMLGLAAPSIGQLGAAVIGVAAWAIVKGELTVEELENNPSIMWNNPHYLGRVVDESGIMAHFGMMASLYGDYKATTVNGISLTKKKKGFVSPLEAVAEGLSSSVTDKPAFQMAGNLAALASGTLGEAEVFGPSLSKFPSWREKLGYFTKPLVPNPLLANLFHMNLQDLYMRQVAPIAQSRIEMNRAVRIGIMNRGSNNGDN